MTPPGQFLLGIIGMGSFVAGLFFVRFWRRTGEHLFAAFALFFFAEFVHRSAVGFLQLTSESVPYFYLMRLLTSLCIIYSIVRKNL